MVAAKQTQPATMHTKYQRTPSSGRGVVRASRFRSAKIKTAKICTSKNFPLYGIRGEEGSLGFVSYMDKSEPVAFKHTVSNTKVAGT